MDAATAVHPTDQTLQAYAFGRLEGASAASVDSHLAFCADCRQRVAEMSADTFLDRLRDAKVQPESPAPDRPPFAGLSMPGVMPNSIAAIPSSSLPSDLADHPDYQVLGELGRGGMGVVYLAWNKLMGRKEVLKVVSRELMDRHRVLDRFLREIRNAAQLHHPNIVTAYSAFRAGESVVFAMEYVEGHDLAQLVKGNGPLSVAHSCNFVYQAAQGLQYAHEQGMVHRDIKPSNLILARQGKRPVVKVLDFGLAKATREGPVDKGLTHEGQMLGTPDYIAPEQSVDAHKADTRADIYSLGCTLYYLLTGRPPFQGASLYEVLQAHHSMEATPLNLVRPEVPWELAAVVGKMMAKEPMRRYQTPGEVAQAIKPFFKAGDAGSTGPKIESSPVGLRTAVEPATQAATSLPPAARLRSAGKTVEPAQAESIWQDLLLIEEREPVPASLPAAAGARGSSHLPWQWLVTVAGVLLFGLSIAWATGVLKIKTKAGVIVLENVPENAVVVVDGGKVTVTPVDGQPVEIEAQPGKHTVTVKRGENVLLGESVTIESGKAFKLTVRRLPLNDSTLLLENVPPDAVVQVDGDGVELSSAAGRPLKIDAQAGTHMVVVKRGDDVLLAERVTFESGRQLTISVRVKEAPGPQPPLQPAPAAALVAQPGSPARSVGAAERPKASSAARVPTQRPVVAWTSRSTGMTFVRIEGGEFLMGSPDTDKDAKDDEKPQHNVQLGPFYLGVTEVTQQEYWDVMGTNPSHFVSPGGVGNQIARRSSDQYPVEQVQWREAIAFCNALSQRDGLAPYYEIGTQDVSVTARQSDGYRLPTEAEWEFACRAGAETRYFFGEDPAEVVKYAWHSGNSEGRTHPVRQKLPNALGLYDMLGNVWEWCWDRYQDNYYALSPARDPRGPSHALRRAVRGGAWFPDSWYCRPAVRYGTPPGDRGTSVGFRVAKDPTIEIKRPSAVIRPNSARTSAATPTPRSSASKSGSKEVTGIKSSRRPSAALTSRFAHMTFVRIEGGEFVMGSPPSDQDAENDEKPQHKVPISPFYLGATEVTQAQYLAVMKTNPSWFSLTGGGSAKIAHQSTAKHPAEQVSWFDAIRFCNGLSEKEGIPTYYHVAGDNVEARDARGPGYRLPAEAEWEYACRAGATTKYFFGDDPAKLGDYAWYTRNSGGTTHPVGKKRPNAFGLYDMQGNVWEWCWDRYDDTYYKRSAVDDPLGTSGASRRVGRGGCWNGEPRSCRSTDRNGYAPGDRGGDLGFRVALGQPAR